MQSSYVYISFCEKTENEFSYFLLKKKKAFHFKSNHLINQFNQQGKKKTVKCLLIWQNLIHLQKRRKKQLKQNAKKKTTIHTEQ